MWRSSRVRYDVATAVDIGGRDSQEDAVIADFPLGSDLGLGILADGMGGHAAGDAASTTVVSEVLRELSLRKSHLLQRPLDVPNCLRDAASSANTAVASHMKAHPKTQGMGSTLVATAFVGPQLFWSSVGDSPLYLHRGRKLTRLNEDHSMAPQIDAMIRQGQIKPEVGRNHPDRGCLTSAITGQKIARLNCPKDPFILQTGDILLVSSDGLHSLDDETIGQVLRKNAKRTSMEIAETLIDAVRDLRVDNQDNTSVIVIKVLHDKPLTQGISAGASASGRPLTRFADQMEVFDASVIEENDAEIPVRRAVGL